MSDQQPSRRNRQPPAHVPTPEEIAAQCAEIRARRRKGDADGRNDGDRRLRYERDPAIREFNLRDVLGR